MKAVIPAAGIGLRFLPLTKSQPKEMLPIVDKPTIHYVVEEAVKSGIDDIIIITGRGKRAIEDYFDKSVELELLCRNTVYEAELQSVDKLFENVEIHYIRQKEQKGLGHAIYCARKHVGDEVFAVLLGDTINVAEIPVLKQIMNVHEKYKSTVIAVENIKLEDVERYGVVSGRKISEKLYLAEGLVEKPKASETPSTIGITGTYILTPAIFECIKHTPPGRNNEIQLTDALNILCKQEPIYAYMFDGKRYDVGTKLDWLKVKFEFCLKDSEYGDELKKFIEVLLNE
jgi:UTP--glucose-1-phosphate uridylyltransferase